MSNNLARIICYFLTLILFVFNSCTLFSCGWDSDLSQVKNEPSNAELCGKYFPDERTLTSVSGFFKTSFIKLTEDNKFTFEGFPQVPTFGTTAYNKSRKQNVKGAGEWKPVFTDGKTHLNVSVSIEDTNPNCKFDLGTNYGLYKKGGKFVIVIEVGDPDGCKVIRLIQK